jgi:hypothetical protein
VELTYDEILEVKASLQSYVDKVRMEIEIIEGALQLLTKISNNKKINVSTIFLPEEILRLNEVKANKKPGIEWKKAVYETIRKSNFFLSSKMIYDRMLVYHPFQLGDKRYSQKCISSALVNLVADGKVGKFKDESGLYFFGDTERHFEATGKPNLQFFTNT